MRLYLDSSAIIYALEGPPDLREAALSWIRRAREAPGGSLITSRLSRVECRSKPIALDNRALVSIYDRFFQICTLGGVSDEVVERATDLRARLRLRTPDAIHLATAIKHEADCCLTGDRGMARCNDLKVVVLGS